MQYVTHLFAQVYGTCSYGASHYQNGSCTAAPPASSSPGLLTNTGFDIAVIVTLACVIGLIAVLVRFWKRPRKPSSPAQ